MGQRIVLVLVGGLFGVVGATGFAGATDPASILINVSVLVFGAWVVFRGFLLGLRIDTKGITDRRVGRSKSVPWCVIREIDTETQGLGAVRTGAPGLVLKGGEHIPLTSLASYSHRTTEANLALLKSLHATHRVTCPDCE
ncbi:hypothetical protein ACFVX6_39290 [Streptomyces sp. NPDC058289]|uniref:hypothetical protein n=1 Tax=Streptomyces sp. NPDC058289 TaxID=3346425 RepID=UPI0036E622E5